MSKNSRPNENELENSKLEEELGNMLLVRVNGELKQVSSTYKNKLLYKHNLYEILDTDGQNSRIVLTDEEDDENFIAIAPTENDSVYQIWLDNNPYPVMNPPSRAEDVLRGVKKSLETPSDYGDIKQVYDNIRSDRVRRFVVQSMESMFGAGQIVPESEGWNIMGIFLLTWDSRIFLNTSDKGMAYRVHGSGVSETETSKQFLQLSISDQTINQYRDQKVKVSYPLDYDTDVSNTSTIDKECPSCSCGITHEYYDDENKLVNSSNNINDDDVNIRNKVFVCSDSSCRLAWQEYSLTEREIEFLAKANWLINHRERLDDEAFWDVVESYVWYNNG